MRRLHRTHRLAPAQGVALVAVLWIMAVLSLMSVGIVKSVREDVRLASAEREIRIAQALTRGAVHTAIQQENWERQPPSRWVQINLRLDGVDVNVVAVPLSGLIDLNKAPAVLLVSLFRHAANLPEAEAQSWAQTIVAVRNQRSTTGERMALEAPEDLLSQLSLPYQVYSKVVNLVTTESSGSGKINPLAAPLSVLAVLADGQRASAEKFARQRLLDPIMADSTLFNPQYTDSGASKHFAIQSSVTMPSNNTIETRWSVDLADAKTESAPWRVHLIHTSSLVAGAPQ